MMVIGVVICDKEFNVLLSISKKRNHAIKGKTDKGIVKEEIRRAFVWHIQTEG